MDRYVMYEPIGNGAYGTVYDAVHTGRESEAPYLAIKEVDIFTCGNIMWPSALWEPSIMRNADHPNIGKVLDTFTYKDNLYMVMPKYDIFDKKIDILILFKLIHALEYLQRNHIMHRDIKSSNIMMDGNEPVIIDFSCGVVCKDWKPCNQREVYSATHRAPEILAGDIHKTPVEYGWKGEVWALGVVAYRCLIGHLPVIGQVPQFMYKLIFGRISTIHKELRAHGSIGDIVCEMLTITPSTRPSLKDLMERPIFNHITHPLYKDIQWPIPSNSAPNTLQSQIESRLPRIASSPQSIRMATSILQRYMDITSLSDSEIIASLYIAMYSTIDISVGYKLTSEEREVVINMISKGDLFSM